MRNLTIASLLFSAGFMLPAAPAAEIVPAAPLEAQASTDVAATMKTMAFQLKQARSAKDIASMQLHLTAFKQAVASVQLVQFPAEKQQKFQQGFREVQAQVSIVEQTLQLGDLTLAQQQLAEIDVLKKQYHQQRSVSFWQLLFG